MSVLAERSDTLPAYEAARNQLYGNLLGGVACVVLVMIVPKDIEPNVLRLALVSIFFLGLTTMLWSAAEPLETLLRARIDLMLEDCGVETRALGHAVVDSISRYMSPFVWILFTLLGLLFLRVLAAWPIGAPLEPAIPLIHVAFWLSVAALPAQVFLSTNRLMEAFSLQRTFRQGMARSRFQPRSVAAARARGAELAGPPVMVDGPYAFRAGGVGWTWSDFQTNAIVFGQTGSGKTVTVLNALLDGLLSCADGWSGTHAAAALILDPKGDFRERSVHSATASAAIATC